MIIAIDGPAAAGKGTLGKALAKAYKLAYLDTGALYRAVAVAVLDAGASPKDETAVVKIAETLDPGYTQHQDLRTEATGNVASITSAYPGVRTALLALQQDFADNPGPEFNGAILDGRDIGTVVCPDADLKLFITASAEARAKRRHKEEVASAGQTALGYAEILADVKARDDRDTNRAIAPMIPADDAHLIDTTDLSIEAAFSRASTLVTTLIEAKSKR